MIKENFKGLQKKIILTGHLSSIKKLSIIITFLTALLWGLMIWYHPSSFPQLVIKVILAFLCLGILYYDLLALRIPNHLSFVIGLLAVLNPPQFLTSFILGTVALILRYFFLKLKRINGLGLGDIKLMYALGLWLPITLVPDFLTYAGLLGIVFGCAWQHFQKEKIFPFAPSLLWVFGYLIFFKLETFEISGMLNKILIY